MLQHWVTCYTYRIVIAIVAVNLYCAGICCCCCCCFFPRHTVSSSVQRPATPRHSCACQLAFGHLRSELAFVIHESENAGRKRSKSYIFYLFTHSFVVFHNFCFSFISALALHAANLERIDNRVWQGSLGVCCQLNFSNCLHFYALFLR